MEGITKEQLIAPCKPNQDGSGFCTKINFQRILYQLNEARQMIPETIRLVVEAQFEWNEIR